MYDFSLGSNPCDNPRWKDALNRVNKVLSENGACKDWMDANGCGGDRAELSCCPSCFDLVGCLAGGGGGYNIRGSNTIHLCSTRAPASQLASTLLHEAVHTCGWWKNEADATAAQKACMGQLASLGP